MIRTVLLFYRIHLRRYWRVLTDLGLFRVIFVVVLFALWFNITLAPAMLKWQAVLLVSVAGQAWFTRKDALFLNNLGLDKPVFFILLYTVFLLPFLLFYLLMSAYTAVLILVTGIAIIPFTGRFRILSARFRLPAFGFIPAIDWEWRVGMRRYLPVILLTCLIQALFFRNELVMAGGILAMSLIANSFQLHHEPVLLVEATGLSPKDYFVHKLVRQCLYFIVLALPAILLTLIFHVDGIRMVLILLINSIFVQLFAVALKYAAFSPGTSTPYLMSVTALMNFTFIFPALLPLPFLLTLFFSRKAMQQLNTTTG